MMSAICLTWIGIKLSAPCWYYIVIGLGTCLGLYQAYKSAKLEREIKDHLDRVAIFPGEGH